MKKDFDLLIIGGESAELIAGWFARQLGLTVAIVEKAVWAGIAQRLVQDGVDLRTSAALQRVKKTATGVRLVLGDGGEVEAGAVSVSVGRRPQVEGLELE